MTKDSKNRVEVGGIKWDPTPIEINIEGFEPLPLPYDPIAATIAVTGLVPIFLEPEDEFQYRLNVFVPDFERINREFISRLERRPELLDQIHWRRFEELLEEVFNKFGYETTLGPGSGDFGVDLRLIQKNDMKPYLILVQAKRYNPSKKIDLQAVQALYGAVETEGANRGMLVTTSSFLPSARRFAELHQYRIDLADRERVHEWLRRYLSL